jgi:hypothetical protein
MLENYPLRDAEGFELSEALYLLFVYANDQGLFGYNLNTISRITSIDKTNKICTKRKKNPCSARK